MGSKYSSDYQTGLSLRPSLLILRPQNFSQPIIFQMEQHVVGFEDWVSEFPILIVGGQTYSGQKFRLIMTVTVKTTLIAQLTV